MATVAEQAVDPRWAGKGPQGQNLVAWRNPATGKTISGNDQGNSAYYEPIWGPAPSSSGGDEGGDSGAPGIEPIDEQERLIESEINEWINGNRGLSKEWVEDAVSRGTTTLSKTRDDVLKESLEDYNARGLTQSGLVSATNNEINKAYLEDISNLRKDLELERATVNLQAKQFGISAGLQLNSLRRNSALGASQLSAQLDIANSQLAESARQFNESLAENSRLTEMQIKYQNKASKSSSLGSLLGSGLISLATL